MKIFKKIIGYFFIIEILILSLFSFSCNDLINTNNYGKLNNSSFFNTIRVDNMLGDPYLMEYDGFYYFTASEGTHITITKSKFMTQLTESEENSKIIMKQSDINAVDIWAPEIFCYDGYFYCYFTASIGNNDEEIDANRRIYVTKSVTKDALGEWEHPKKMNLPCDYWAIDATYFLWKDRHFILWSGWPNAENNNFEQHIYISELQSNDPTKVISIKSEDRIQISKPIYEEWESNGSWMNEGPAVIISPNGRPYVFYSTNSSQSNWYCIAYCKLKGNTEEEMLSNILKKEADSYGNSVGWYKNDQPFMQTNLDEKEVIAPGHNCFVKSPDGTEDWIVYHSTKKYQEINSILGWDRLVRFQKLSWKEDEPYLEYYPYFSEKIPLPSGEKIKRYIYEAEEASLTEDCSIIESREKKENKNYSYASNDKSVSISKYTDFIKFNVSVKQNGKYVLQVRYSNLSNFTNIFISVNNKKYKLYAPQCNSFNCFMTNGFYTDLYIKPSGPNEIIVRCDKNILIDCIIIDYL